MDDQTTTRKNQPVQPVVEHARRQPGNTWLSNHLQLEGMGAVKERLFGKIALKIDQAIQNGDFAADSAPGTVAKYAATLQLSGLKAAMKAARDNIKLQGQTLFSGLDIDSNVGYAAGLDAVLDAPPRVKVDFTRAYCARLGQDAEDAVRSDDVAIVVFRSVVHPNINIVKNTMFGQQNGGYRS